MRSSAIGECRNAEIRHQLRQGNLPQTREIGQGVDAGGLHPLDRVGQSQQLRKLLSRQGPIASFLNQLCRTRTEVIRKSLADPLEQCGFPGG